ncbi:MAG: 1-acyl-sn-glycerol-3-phosphate acyltransferase [Bradymonadia bacterium]
MSEFYSTRTGMVQRFSLWVRIFFLWIYARVFCEPKQIQAIKALPEDESLVYVLESDNKHDFLFLNYLCLKHGLPLAFASNGKSKRRFASLWQLIRAIFRKRKRKSEMSVFLRQCIRERKPILLFLHSAGRKAKDKEQLQRIFDAMHQIQCFEPDTKIRFLTTTIIWERRAENLKHTFFNEIYGTPTRPSSVRRLLSVIPGIHQIFFKIGVPLCLIQSEEILAPVSSGAALQLALQSSIERARETVLGPKLKSHQVIKQEILSSTEFIADLKALSHENEISIEILLGQASKILNKTASKFSFLVVKILCTLLTPIWSLIYNGLYIEKEKLNFIRELSKTHRIVFVPSHKSHIDYLVLSYLLFQYGHMPPLIAAGENLNFFPIGSLLRRGGAFFIRRSFKGDRLYQICVQHYINKLIEEGYPLEFFIEGGRSRTGQVLQPKYGILRMIARTGIENPNIGIKFIPAAITYEKVIEDQAYQKEQQGEKKNKENISNLIKTTKVLISKYGQLYASFGEPLDLRDYLGEEQNCWRGDDQDLNERIERLGLDIVQQINHASTITISALLSTALLNATKDKIEYDAICNDAALILSILLERNSRISPTLKVGLASHRATLHDGEDAETHNGEKNNSPRLENIVTAISKPLRESLRLMTRNSCVEIKKHSPDIIIIEEDARLQLAFYKNSLLYAIIDEIYAAAAVLRNNNIENSEKGCEAFKQISELFSYEFVLTASSTYEDALNRFSKRDWLKNTDSAEISESGQVALRYLKRCILPFAQAYLHTAMALAQAKQSSVEEERFIEDLLQSENSKFTLTLEARSKILFNNAVRKYASLGIIKIKYKQIGKKTYKMLEVLDSIPQNYLLVLEDLVQEPAYAGEETASEESLSA